MGESNPTSRRRLAAGDPAPFSVENAGAEAPVVLVCDHAGRAVPASLGRLGLPDREFDRHIAWDIGAGDLTLLIGRALGACVIRQTYSRLVIDCNRDPARPDAVVERSDGADVPGNIGLSAEDRAARVAEVHRPYHDAIAAELDRRGDAPTALVLMHSFTPSMGGVDRPWELGVLHLNNSPLCFAMLELLRAEPGLTIGDNEPYAMDGTDYTAPFHAITRGIDYLELEVRQDLIADAAGRGRIGELLVRLIPQALAKAGIG